MTDTTPVSSPDSLQLRGAPSASARLSRNAALTAVAVLGVILGVVIFNVSKRQPEQNSAASGKKELEPALSVAKSFTKDVPDVIAAPLPPPQTPVLAPMSPPVQHAPVKSTADDALLADTAVPKFVESEATAIHPAVAGWSAESRSQAEDTGLNPGADTNSGGIANDSGAGYALRAVSTLAGGASGQPANEPDLNHQDEKLGFLQKTRRSTYLNSRLTAPISPFELKTGTVIPGILLGAMNSDLPGEVIAQVSQNVYDTASGEHLLIPQGTRLYGHYDSNVSFGQGRLVVSWQRLIYPNAYTLELAGMSGHDEAGSAGFADRVNHHYGRIFGWALLTSVLSAGAQLSQPQQTSVLTTPGTGQVAAAAVGQQMTQVGVQMAQRNMQVQPTIVIRKGYRFNVMVNKDIVFPGDYQP